MRSLIAIFLLFLFSEPVKATSAREQCRVLFDLIERSSPWNYFSANDGNLVKRLKDQIQREQKLAEPSEKENSFLVNLPGGEGWTYHSKSPKEKGYSSRDYETIDEKIGNLSRFTPGSSPSHFNLSGPRRIRELVNTKNFLLDQSAQSRREFLNGWIGLVLGLGVGITRGVINNPENIPTAIVNEAKAATVKNLPNHLAQIEQVLKELGSDRQWVKRTLEAHQEELNQLREKGDDILYGARPIDYKRKIFKGVLPIDKQILALATQDPRLFTTQKLEKEFQVYITIPPHERDAKHRADTIFSLDDMRRKAQYEETGSGARQGMANRLAGGVLGGAMGWASTLKPRRDLETLIRNRGKESEAPPSLLKELQDFVNSPKPGIHWYWVGRKIGEESVELIIYSNQSTRTHEMEMFGVRYQLKSSSPKEESVPVTEPRPSSSSQRPTDFYSQLAQAERDLVQNNFPTDFGETSRRIKKIFKDAREYVSLKDLGQFLDRAADVKKETDLKGLENLIQYLKDKKEKGGARRYETL